jgi:hypothetical protein
MRHKLLYCSSVLAFIVVAPDCGSGGQSGNGPPVANSDKATQGADTLYHLTLDKQTIEQAIDPKAAGNKFVQVEVTQVTNPAKHPLTFEVRYRPKSGLTVYLGSFSLYPADNPGKFIVATQGRVNAGGAIILTLVAQDKAASADDVRVAVKPPTLLKE